MAWLRTGFFVAAVLAYHITATLSNPQSCPPSWHQYGNSCYIVSHHRLNWFEAEVTCKALGGHLVTIESSAENSFVGTLVRNAEVRKAWIGLFDVAAESQFVWTTTLRTPQYTYWSSGQPDNYSNNEDCVELIADNRDLWNDIPCHESVSFICERLIYQ